jgi:uncharacterized protein
MPQSSPLNLAVITGGHSYSVPEFHRLFHSLPNIAPIIQHMDDFASSPAAVRQAYDVVLFYIMLLDGPADDKLPWHVGKPLTAMSELGQTSQGIVILHHALLAYPQFPAWDQLTGMTGRKSFTFKANQTLRIRVADQSHPITRGLTDWDLVDETYTMPELAADSTVLLTTDHPTSMRHIAWTRQYRNSRIFNFQSGHDPVAWANPSFREILRRGILWAKG